MPPKEKIEDRYKINLENLVLVDYSCLRPRSHVVKYSPQPMLNGRELGDEAKSANVYSTRKNHSYFVCCKNERYSCIRYRVHL